MHRYIIFIKYKPASENVFTNNHKPNLTLMKKHTPFVLSIALAIILIQTLRFKFTAHPDSVYIFTKAGLEPNGRIGIGVLVLIASILLFIPKTIWAGAVLTLGIIGGAIFMHLTK